MTEHEIAPLNPAEARTLRAIVQELARTDPSLMREPLRPGRWQSDPAARGGLILAAYVMVGVLRVAGPGAAVGPGTATGLAMALLFLLRRRWRRTGDRL